MRNRVLLILLLCASFCRGQHVVMLPTGFAPVDVSVIDAANTVLSTASQSSGFDIKMAFLTSLSGVNGRYEVYKQLQPDYMEFFRTPNGSAFTGNVADLAAEHDRLIRKAVDTLEVGSEKSVTIIYTTVINLTASGLSHDSKKTVFYSNDFSDCDKRRFEQIEDFNGKPVDFCVTSAEAENNAYVAWYSSKLSEATSNDNIITGSIAFAGGIYCEPVELYVNDQHNGVLTSTSDYHPPIRLMVHPEMDAPSITWSSPTSSATLFTSGSGEYNTLNFQPAAFEQFNELVADWGNGQQSSISVLPVNFQVTVDEELLEQQSNQIQSVSFYNSNNGEDFPNRPEIKITLKGVDDFAGAPDLTLINPGMSGPILTWQPSPDGCGINSMEITLLPNDKHLSLASHTHSFEMLCPFTILDLDVKVPATQHTKKAPLDDLPVYRYASHGQKLYIVAEDGSDLEDEKRNVSAEIIWEGERPDPDEYWTNDPDISTDDEPVWRSSPSGTDVHLPDYATIDTWTLEHADIFPPPINSLVPPAFSDLFDHPPNEFAVTVDAFEQSKQVDIVLTRRNEAEYSNTVLSSNIQKVIDKAAGISDKIQTWLGPNRPGQWPLSPVFKVTPKMKAWNEEDIDSRFYFNKTETEVSIEIGMMLGDTTPPKKYLPLILPPPIGPTHRSFAGGKVEAGFGLAGKLTIKPKVIARAKKFNYEGMLDMTFEPISVTGTVTTNLKIGAYARAKVDVGNVSIISFSVSGELGPTFTATLHYEWDEDTSDYEFYIDGEMSPLEGDITATLSVLGFEVVDFSLMEFLELDGAIGPYPFDSRDYFGN